MRYTFSVPCTQEFVIREELLNTRLSWVDKQNPFEAHYGDTLEFNPSAPRCHPEGESTIMRSKR
eukprot:4639362-Karenia_brevis.AAC.1